MRQNTVVVRSLNDNSHLGWRTYCLSLKGLSSDFRSESCESNVLKHTELVGHEFGALARYSTAQRWIVSKTMDGVKSTNTSQVSR